MRWLDEVRSVEISEIRKPDDWDEVLSEERTKALAANMPQTDGPVNLPVLNAATMDIVAGRHRIAACSLAGRPRVQCRMWTGSPAQERLLRASDNAFPRDDYDAWVHELVSANAAVIEEERAAGIPDKLSRDKPGPRTGARGEARQAVAALLGKSTDAVRKADERGDPEREKRIKVTDHEGREFDGEKFAPPSEPIKPDLIEDRIADLHAALEPFEARARALHAEAKRVQEARGFKPADHKLLPPHTLSLSSAASALAKARDHLTEAIAEIKHGREKVAATDRAVRTGLGGRRL